MAKKKRKIIVDKPVRVFGKALSSASKSVRAKPRLSNYFLSYGNAFGGGGRFTKPTQRVKEGPGRPRGDFKHRDPFTGKPIPATLYYKKKKEFFRLQQQQSQLQDQKEIQQLAKRGIPPEQARQVVNRRQERSVGIQQQLTPEQLQQLNEEREMPQQMPSIYPSQAVRPIWRRRGYEDTEWTAFGKKRVVRGIPQSYWN